MRSCKTLFWCAAVALSVSASESGCGDSVARIYGGQGAAAAASASGGPATSSQPSAGERSGGNGGPPSPSSGVSGTLATQDWIGGAATTSGNGSLAAPHGGSVNTPVPLSGANNSSAGAAGWLTGIGGAGFLHVEENRLLDDSGRQVRLTGVNWFGFETSNLSPRGLWVRDYRSMLKQIYDLGFNSVRIPWCDAMLADGALPNSINTYGADPYDTSIDPMNGPLVGKSPIEIMDLVVAAAGALGLKLILDNHSRKPDGYADEKVWYTNTVSEEQWIGNWVSIAKRYRGNPTVIGFDLDNEPHGEASWATGNAATDWNAAAERCGNAILAVNPDALIIVEGIEKVGTDGYWWGGNLSAARAFPITLSKPEKLVYSAHERGPEVSDQPWFSAADFPSNLPAVWDEHFGFLMKENLGHVLIGEFGLKDQTAANGRAELWFNAFLTYAGQSFSWTFSSWDPNTGDTEGILAYDWLTPKQWKVDALRPNFAPRFK